MAENETKNEDDGQGKEEFEKENENTPLIKKLRSIIDDKDREKDRALREKDFQIAELKFKGEGFDVDSVRELAKSYVGQGKDPQDAFLRALSDSGALKRPANQNQPVPQDNKSNPAPQTPPNNFQENKKKPAEMSVDELFNELKAEEARGNITLTS